MHPRHTWTGAALGAALALALGSALVACDKDKPSSDPPGKEAMMGDEPGELSGAAKGEAASPSQGVLTLEGKLTYTELPRTKSVAAYMGQEFTLTTASGESHNLKASDAVPFEELVKHDGQQIKVTCEPYVPKPPDPMESYPTGPDGKPLQRPGGCRVLSLTTP